ncbi:MAG: hypothetical protein AMS18_14490 [Gemmatimonas sp. SG8_17]|nr:MAG: hypothetical protein AMS18_14490 [Gemmatimonas sp. SG8_17]
MNTLTNLSAISLVLLYGLIAMIAVLTIIVGWAQIGCLRGHPFKNPDGTIDDCREQKLFYGIAWADLVVACPLSLVGLVAVFTAPRIGLLLLTGVSVWLVWANVMTTVTSLRFEKPRITLQWLLVFPFGSFVGLAYLIWMLFHFEAVYG